MPGIDIGEHLDEFKAALGRERDAIDGKTAKMWFVDYLGKTPKDVVEKFFDPSGHDGKWEREHAKIGQPGGDVHRRNQEERCVCYLSSGQRDMNIRYFETELTSLERSKAPSASWLTMDGSLSMYLGATGGAK